MATGYRARLKQRRVNRKNSDVGGAANLLPSSRFQKFAHSPRIRSSLPAKSNFNPEYLRENFCSERPAYRKSIRFYPSLTKDPTKVNFEERKASPIVTQRVYTIGTTTSNVPWTTDERIIAKEADDTANSTLTNFALGNLQSSVSPKTQKILQNNIVFQNPPTGSTLITSPSIPETNPRRIVTFAGSESSSASAAMVKRKDNWPTCQPIGTASINGLHNNGKHQSRKEEMLRGHLHGDTLTGGYTVSNDPIATYRSKLQNDYVWPTVHASEWRLPQAGGRPCLFDLSAEHLKGFRGGGGSSKVEEMMNSRVDLDEYDQNDIYDRNTARESESSANSSRAEYARGRKDGRNGRR